MRNQKVVLALVMVWAFLLPAYGVQAKDGFAASQSLDSTSVPSIDAQDLEKEMKSASPPVVIDVRQPEERKNGVIVGDKNIPLGELDKRYSELPKDKPVVIYCRSGRRSANAVAKLMEKGYRNVKSLVGGINGWSKEAVQLSY